VLVGLKIYCQQQKDYAYSYSSYFGISIWIITVVLSKVWPEVAATEAFI
jgi:hypothetical protein